MQTSHLNEELLAALATVIDPELRQPITELGMVDRAKLTGSVADIRVLLTIEDAPCVRQLRRTSALRSLPWSR